MARINIEDCWWTDPRRSRLARLIGSEAEADGIVIRAWRIAQEFWGKNRGLVPVKVWETVEANSKLIEAKLAEERPDGVYVCGSSQYLEWVHERRLAAIAGGKKSAKVRAKKGSNQPKKSANVEPKPNQTQPSVSGSYSISDSNSLLVLENPSAPLLSNLSFDQESEKVRQYFNNNKLKHFKKYVPRIIHVFETYESFAFWFNDLTKGAEIKITGDPSGVRRYVQASLINEIGIKHQESAS